MKRSGLRDLAGALRLGPAVIGATLLLRGDGAAGPEAPAMRGPPENAMRQSARSGELPLPAFTGFHSVAALPGGGSATGAVRRKAMKRHLLASASSVSISTHDEHPPSPQPALRQRRAGDESTMTPAPRAGPAPATPLVIGELVAEGPLADLRTALPALPEIGEGQLGESEASPGALAGKINPADSADAPVALPRPAFGQEAAIVDTEPLPLQVHPALTMPVLTLVAPEANDADEPDPDGPQPAASPPRLAHADLAELPATGHSHGARRLIAERRADADSRPGVPDTAKWIEPANAQAPPAQAPAKAVPAATPAIPPATGIAPRLPEPQFGQGASASPQEPGPPQALPEPEFGQARPRLAVVAPASLPTRDDAAAAATAARGLPRPAFGGAASRLAQPVAKTAPGGAGTAAYAGNVQTWPGKSDAAAGAPQLTYDDQLILEVRVGRGEAADTVIAYGTRQGVYLPLGALARLFDLAINVSDDGHFASGWFISEDRTLTIDLRRHKVFLRGEELPLRPADAVAFDGELYLKVDLFSDIFPLKMRVNLRDQAVEVQTLETFPFEARMAREAAREKLEAGQHALRQKQWPRQDAPYRMFSAPLSDVELRAGSDSNLGTRGEADLRMSGDLAFLTAQTFLSGTTRDGLAAARIQLGREDPGAGLLGPLKATSFQFGDVSVDPLPIGLTGTAGRGAYISNRSPEQASVFDKVDLRGALPDGYEVELYRNDILLGSTRIPVNGQYEFLQIPLDFGLNVLRLVFYGPQGQRYEEVRRMNVGDGRLGRGQLVYQVGAVEKDVNLLGVTGPNFYPTTDYGARRLTASVSYGLSSKITALLGGAWYQTRAQDRWQVSGGVRSAIGGIALRLDAAAQKGGGSGYQLGLGGALFGALNWRAVHSEYRGLFIDEDQTYTNDFLRRATQVDLSAALRFGDGTHTLPLSARIKRLEFADGHRTLDASLRSSVVVSGFIASNTFDYSSTHSNGGGGSSQLLGAFDLATLSASRTQLRGSLGYAIMPRPRLMQVTVGIDHAFDKRTLLHASIGETFAGGLTQLGLSAARRFDRFTLAVDGSYEVPTGTYSAMLRLGFSFGRNPLNGRAFMDQPGLATGGATALRAFRDVNADGRFDAGDKALEGIDFVSGSQSASTDSNGVAFLGHLGAGTRSSVQMDPTTLPDIALAPVTRGVEIVPRPGRVQVVDFPVQTLAEVEGNAYFKSAAHKRGVSGLRLQLVNAAGKIVASARSEADGYFLFEQVPPGAYAVRIAPDQAERLDLSLLGDDSVEIRPGATSAEHDVTVAVH